MITILMYHQVAEISKKLDPLGLAVPPRQFEQQMSFLARNGYQCLNLSDAVHYFGKGESAPVRSFVLTFDDGYQNFYANACPILEKYGFTATIFLVVGRMGTLSNWWGQEGDRSGLLLTWAEARDLLKRKYILGSHTLNHPFLTLLDDQSAFDEIRNSKLLLQDRLGMKVDFFSYPYSETDARIERLVKKAGYTGACAGDEGGLNIFHQWRVPCLRDDTTLSFALKASGWYNKRTALRESIAGQLLRRVVRTCRKWLGIHSPRCPAIWNHDLGIKTEREQ